MEVGDDAGKVTASFSGEGGRSGRYERNKKKRKINRIILEN